MNKKDIFNRFIASLEAELLVLHGAAKATAEYATHSENKPENKYDTRGLEASYLAGAQALRVAEMQDVLLTFKNTRVRDFMPDEVIAIGALVEVVSQHKTSRVLVMPLGGGQSIGYQGLTIQVVTPQSPIGRILIGRKVNEEVRIETGRAIREYDIISVE